MNPKEPRNRTQFPSTRWSVVLKANGDGGEREQALSHLCGAYWYPVYAFLRNSGNGSDDSKDLTQSFFQTILQRDSIARADPHRGRFRTYVLTMLKGHLVDSLRKSSATKRGGGIQFSPFNADLAEHQYSRETEGDLPPDRLFDQRWGRALLEAVMGKLLKEYEENGKAEAFKALESYIPWNYADEPQQHVADALGIGVAAVRMEVYYLRRRFRELLNAEVAETVATADDVEAELRELRRVFAREP